MNVLIVALEFSPFVQTSPTAESIASLAKALRLLGHDVTVATPKLPAYEAAGLLAARQLSPLECDDGRQALLYDAQLSSGVTLCLVQTMGAQFDSDQDLLQQAEPLGAFAAAIAALCQRREAENIPFDVVHAHDAGAGLALLKLQRKVGRARVLSVHDASRAGQFPLSSRQALGIPEERTGTSGFGAADGLCLLKGVVADADAVVAPSEAYSRKLKAPEKYGALSRAFQTAPLFGVPEGVDHAVFNPATDPALVSRYDAPDPTNKGRNKVSVLKDWGLDFDVARPVFFCESVPDGECAVSTLVGALPALIRSDVSLIVLGAEDIRKENASLIEPFSSHVHWSGQMSASDRRRALAAADFYLSIRRRDPSGQLLLQAARYGAIPVACGVDAVSDVIVDCDAELKTGTGIVFESMTQRALQGAVTRAVSAFRSAAFGKLVRRVMRQDLAWDRSARRHVQIYRNIVTAQV